MLDLATVMRARARAALVLMAMVSLTACALEEPSTESTTQSVICSVFFCGDNAASAGDGLVFDELDLFQRANYAGVRMLGATRVPFPGALPVPLTLDVIGHTLRGIAPDNSVLEGFALVDTLIKMEYSNSGSSETFELLIADFDQKSVRFAAGDPEVIPHYLIKARRPAKNQKEFLYVCNREVLPTDPLWTQIPHHALIYRGDRYVPNQKRVMSDNDPSDGWSFLACAGSAGAKLHVFRHTYAGAFNASRTSAPFMTSPEKRTILLKALTADYCGNGSTFTVNGQPLTFTAAAPFRMPAIDLTIAWAPPPVPRPDSYGVRSHEAIWDINGAYCIDQPRRDPILVTGYPTWSREQIYSKCGRTIPACAPLIADWSSFGYAVTANPWPR